MKLIDIIKTHLYYDYSLSKASMFLKESAGFYNPLLGISEEIYTEYLREIKDCVLKYGSYSGTLCFDGHSFKNSFFDKIVIRTIFIQEKVPFADINGCYLSDESGYTDDGYTVSVYIGSSGQDDDFHNKFVCFLCHELTHAYEDYCEFKSTGQSYMKSIEPETIDRSALAQCLKTGDKDMVDLYSLIQYTLKSEQNAEQASFASEIMLKRQGNPISDYGSMVDLFHDTVAYRTLEKRESQLDSLRSITDSSKRDILTKAFNEIYVGSRRNYDEVMNFLSKKFNERKHRLIKTGSKSMVKAIECLAENPLRFHIM